MMMYIYDVSSWIYIISIVQTCSYTTKAVNNTVDNEKDLETTHTLRYQ